MKTFSGLVDTPVYIDTEWTTQPGYTLKGETVSCALKKVGTTGAYQYCQTKTVGSQTDNKERITFTFKASTGTYYIYTYSTGTLSDNSALAPLADGIAAHCP